MKINFEHLKGLFGEWFVVFFYLFSGFRIIKHRYKAKTGEIDLIFRRGKLIVFCEVKTRIGIKFDMNHIDGIVSRLQMERILKSSQGFMNSDRYKNFYCRFDIAVVRSFVKFPLIIKNFTI